MAVFWFVLAGLASGQQCPQADPKGFSVASSVQFLDGRLIFHGDLRRWFELKLDRPQCGQTSIQLIASDGSRTSLAVLRGCHVRSKGTIDEALTGYYSLELFQDVTGIDPLGECLRKAPLPDFSAAKPAKNIQHYEVEMGLDYTPGDHPVAFRVTSGGVALQPWQAYASYTLTGGFVLYGHCGEGFVVDHVSGTPEANPSHFDEPRTANDMATFDPESAAAAGKKNLRLRYTCVRHSQ